MGDAVEITGVYQHEAWLRRDLPPTEQLRPDLWSIPVPIPNNPLRYVSTYVFAGAGSLTLIDPGWESEEGWAALQAGLADIGGSVADVRGVLVTHMHFDHIGLAGRVREASGAWVALHEADRDVLARPDFRDAREAATQERRWLRALGAPADELDTVVGPPETFEPFMNIALPDRLLANGDTVDVAGWALRAVHTPGHTPGHLCFADREHRVLFSGDHILPRITPNISFDRSETGDPLGDFLGSLAVVGSIETEEVFPAHEWRFRGLATRVDQIARHHERRLDELMAAVGDHPASTPWELAGYLTWSRSWDQYSGRMKVLAVGETAAHLRHLVVRGRVVRYEGPVYRSVLAE